MLCFVKLSLTWPQKLLGGGGFEILNLIQKKVLRNRRGDIDICANVAST
jgi:hypothetical protein